MQKVQEINLGLARSPSRAPNVPVLMSRRQESGCVENTNMLKTDDTEVARISNVLSEDNFVSPVRRVSKYVHDEKFPPNRSSQNNSLTKHFIAVITGLEQCLPLSFLLVCLSKP